MKERRVLFVNQEIEPYVVGTQMASMGLKLPEEAMGLGMEVRTFMPKFGVINERRNQLHEVIRLSGLNLVIAGGDHPLLIKVASLMPLRLQVYFIDNEDYFLRRGIFHDEMGMPYADNTQRALFFAMGVLETVKKLRWVPDVVHCNGWFTAFIPALIRTKYGHEPIFSNTKIITSLYEDDVDEPAGEDTGAAVKNLKISDAEKAALAEATHGDLCRLAIRYSDVVACGENEVAQDLLVYAKEKGKMLYDLRVPENLKDFYAELYEEKVVD